MAQNPVAHKHAKQIDLDCHFVRELVGSGRLAVRHVPTSLQLADIFTKALPCALFEVFPYVNNIAYLTQIVVRVFTSYMD